MPEKVSVVTLGCEKNLVDSEIMSGLIHRRCRAEIGEIRRVRITHAYEYDLSGEGIA